jgi:hypothetical protein
MIPRLEVAFALAGRPTSPNAMRRQHWGARSSDHQTWRRAAYLSALDALRRSGLADSFPLRRASVTVVFVLVSAHGDLDNLLAGSKPILDGISRGLGSKGERGPLLFDDGVGCLEELHVRWRRGRTAGVEVYVREVL